MSYLDINSLVVIGNNNDSNMFLSAARRFSYRSYEIESSITNVISRLQDPDYNVCFIFESVLGKEGLTRFLARLKGNLQAKQVPIVIIPVAPAINQGEEYYDMGAQFVIDNLSEKTIKQALMLSDSWIQFCNQFKEGREKLFRR